MDRTPLSWSWFVSPRVALLGWSCGVGLFGSSALGLSCATEEEVLYGDPARVVGGGGPGPTTNTGATGGACEPDPSCTVSFEADVFPIFAGPSACGEGPCHEAATSDFQFDKTDPAQAYEALLAYQLDDEAAGGPYVVGCQPEASRLLCNLEYAPGVASPFGECGVLMPQLIEDAVNDAPIDADQQAIILEWIECGAPDN